MVSKSLSSMRWGEREQAHEGRQRALVGTPRMGGSHEARQRGCWVSRGGDCDVLVIGMGICLYVYSHPS
jgi:UDP-N-acetylmuramyl pentapeptide phosphotransferase/UDP-N-acetylglucosamine-1-phosphate transferase